LGAIAGRPVAAVGDEELRATIVELARRVAELEARALSEGNRTPSLGFSDDKLATIATSMWSARLHRANHFNPALFGEPAWDMLLDLFVHKVRGRRQGTTSLCMGANVPQSTGLRYVERLEREGLLHRYSPADDRRLSVVEMTPKGFRLMREYISNAVTRFKVPLPD
jgi:predicted transcriptional regulator